MARLPVVGDDEGTWGDILNDFLSQVHAPNGLLKPGTIGTDQIQDGAVTNAKLAGPVVHSVSAGAGITVDNTDPANPIVSAIGGGTGTVVSVNNVDPDGSGNVELTPGDIGAADASHTHSAATTTDPGFMSASDKTKLDSIASGATANSPDATLLNRANHTGTQEISTVNGLQTVLDGKASAVHTHAINDVTNLQTTLDGKADTSHTHTATDISDSTTTGRAVLTAADAATARAAIGAGTSDLTLAGDGVATTAARSDHSHQIEIEDINANGTPSASTFLRGDGEWATPPSGNVLVLEDDDDIPIATPANTVIVRKSPS